MDANDFDKWLDKQPAFSLPGVAWGPHHTQIAVAFAADMTKDTARSAVNHCLDEALNSGDGSYRP